MNVLSLFSGCLGLDLGLELVGFNAVAYCENDPACQKVIRARRPGVPLVRDVHHIDPLMVDEVDAVVGGFPCQDLSYAGRGAGLDGDRSGLWFEMARCIRVLRPRLVLVENVPGLVTRGLGRVLYDLAEAGYVGSWFRLFASDVGAPHGRERLFIVAADPQRVRVDADGRLRGGDAREPGGPAQASVPTGAEVARAADAVAHRAGAPANTGSERLDGSGIGDEERAPAHRQDGRTGPARSPVPAADADDSGRREHGGAVATESEFRTAERGGDEAAADADGRGRQGERLEEPGGVEGTRRGLVDGRDPVRELEDAEALADAVAGLEGSATEISWGIYAPAVERWEYILGRAAPRPTDNRGRLSPRFSEWMLGFPDGWVDVKGVSRTHQLRMLGNSVQVQCGALVGLLLLEQCADQGRSPEAVTATRETEN